MPGGAPHPFFPSHFGFPRLELMASEAAGFHPGKGFPLSYPFHCFSSVKSVFSSESSVGGSALMKTMDHSFHFREREPRLPFI